MAALDFVEKAMGSALILCMSVVGLGMAGSGCSGAGGAESGRGGAGASLTTNGGQSVPRGGAAGQLATGGQGGQVSGTGGLGNGAGGALGGSSGMVGSGGSAGSPASGSGGGPVGGAGGAGGAGGVSTIGSGDGGNDSVCVPDCWRRMLGGHFPEGTCTYVPGRFCWSNGFKMASGYYDGAAGQAFYQDGELCAVQQFSGNGYTYYDAKGNVLGLMKNLPDGSFTLTCTGEPTVTVPVGCPAFLRGCSYGACTVP